VPETRRSIAVLALTGIILLALGIRTGVAAISPLAPAMDLDVAMEGLPLGIIGTIPPIAYALSAWFSPWLAKKVGLETAAIAVGVLGALAHVWRGVSPTFLSLFCRYRCLDDCRRCGKCHTSGLGEALRSTSNWASDRSLWDRHGHKFFRAFIFLACGWQTLPAGGYPWAHGPSSALWAQSRGS